ncbi:hypothetical protein Dsin_009014 [Dipteronia sinensis]|uniref:Reverse transcriptase n=1 Tax=Dipteronia sinensis TaxID=43782 RepID=A0AAE0AR06_9ROSI|nr:hypothetical protein Dsin_009014 [Dipteronia sinensis]
MDAGRSGHRLDVMEPVKESEDSTRNSRSSNIQTKDRGKEISTCKNLGRDFDEELSNQDKMISVSENPETVNSSYAGCSAHVQEINQAVLSAVKDLPVDVETIQEIEVPESVEDSMINKGEVYSGRGQVAGSAKMDVDSGLVPTDDCWAAKNGMGLATKNTSKAEHGVGPKKGKWKRWARDGMKANPGLESEVQVGKRSSLDDKIMITKKQKLDVLSVAAYEKSGCSKNISSFTKAHNPDIVFFMETKVNNVVMENIHIKLKFFGKLVVNSVGRSGGLCLFWSKDIDVSLLSFTNYYIDIQIVSQKDTRWCFTGFYGHPDASQRYHAWTLLRRLKSMSCHPWVCAGDFNEILEDSEKVGGNQRPRFLIENFRTALDDCSLQDIGFTGPSFTWCNKKEGSDMVLERVDRCVRQSGSCQPAAELSRSRRFHFEECWAEHEGCAYVVHNAWGEEVHQEELRRASSDIRDGTWVRIRRNIERDLDGLLEHDEDFWRQRSREFWLKSGDRNTKYFHSRASSRRNRNRIRGLIDNDGNWVDDHDKICSVVVDYFGDVFCSSGTTQGDIDRVLQCIQPCLPDGKKALLDAKFTSEDVRTAVFDMYPTKAPLLDGLPTLFYQKFWSVIGDQVTKACLGVLNDGHSLQDVNGTFIALIPKVTRAVKVSEFRPISLCNVIYKIVAKAIANRFRMALGDVISGTQSAFIPGRLISDSAIVGFECMHALRTRKKEGLSPLFFLAERRGNIAGFRCSRGGPRISHLFFTDDSMVFTRAHERDCQAIKSILDCYSKASDQLVNFQKSAMCVSRRVPNQRAARLAIILDGSNEESNKIHWGAWKKLCCSKYVGGLGFRDLANQALLAKQCWRLVHFPNTLAAKVLKHCYFPDCSVIQATDSSSSSFLWKSFIWGPSSSGLSSFGPWWKFFWRLKMPSKIKLLIWRACHNWIRTNGNLARRGINVDTLCLYATPVQNQPFTLSGVVRG